MDAPSEPLTFAALDRCIAALPEGPVAELTAPRWQRWLDMTPGWWMVWMSRAGLAMTACFLPGVARSAYLVLRGMRRWRPELVAQLDHDMVAMEALQAWLSRHPRTVLESHLWFARHAQARLTQKIGFLLGGIDKVGVALVLGALSTQLKAFVDGSVPWWLALIAMMVAVLSGVGVMAGLLRLRLQLYEAVLDDALRRHQHAGL